MKKIALLTSAFLGSLVLTAQTKITFQPQWTAQSQFAGFYVALEKGFYADEGLDVTITHRGVNSTTSVTDQLFNGNADIVGMQLIQAMVSRSDNVPILNVMQLTQKSGLWAVSHNPISKPEDLDGLKVGRWRVGFADFCDMLEFSTGIHIDWIPFINGINLYVFGAVDATLCYSYSEFVGLELSLGEIEPDHILKFSDFGYLCPEDGLYVTEEYYRKNKDAVDKFVRASKKGWDYARENIGEALEISKKFIEKEQIVTNDFLQKRMLEEYLNLQVNSETGVPDYAPVRKDIFKDINDALVNTGYITRDIDYNELIR